MISKRASVALAAATLMVGAVVVTQVVNALPAGSAASAGMSISVPSGDSSTVFSLTFAAPNNVCPGDTATGNYRVNTFMVPASVDAATLTYNSGGPIAPAGVSPVFPLFSAAGQASQVNKNTAVTTGQLIGLQTLSFGVFTPGDIPAGQYKIGYACSKAPALGQPQETERYWQQVITVTASAAGAGGPAQFTWTTQSHASDRGVGNGITVTSGNAGTTFALTLTSPSNVCQGDTATGGYRWQQYVAAASVDPATITIAAGALSAPGGGFVQPLYSTTGSPQVNRNTAVSTGQITGIVTNNFLTNTIPGNGSYNVGFLCTLTGNTTRHWVTPITVSGYVDATTFNWRSGIEQLPQVVQTLTVTKPRGALVLTQRCGAFGALPGVFDDDFGFLPNLPESGNGPEVTSPCAVSMGTAQALTSGPNQGSFYVAFGRLNQLVVNDSRGGSQPWTLSGRMASFVGPNGAPLDSRFLGWFPSVTSVSPPTGTGYAQRVDAGPVVTAGRDGGLSLSRALASAQPGSNLGVARLDARLKLILPIELPAGDYSGTLTFTLV